ncbi:Uncharacterised protein [Pseudomonas fluorescens]|uniref:DUF7673 domain-containing protein n=1 Tax=Pseudomonas fluorescens TaxID=294 RepID=A0A448DVR8_PSEFL|nr:Uncharacterised protein [Pseudomonas fluorescens]
MSGAPFLRDLPEPYFSQSFSYLNAIQNAPSRHRLFEALDLGLNFLRELSARGLISPEDTVEAGRLWGDSADKRLYALPELGSPAPIHPFAKNATLEPVLDMATQSALEHLLALAERDTMQSRKVANFLLAWWNATENGGFDFADLHGLNAHTVSSCSAVFSWIGQNAATPEAIGYAPRFRALALKWHAVR